MIGLLINELEFKEIEYLVKRELEELLFDLDDPRIDQEVKQAMRKRYGGLFNLYKRVAPQQECMKYVLSQHD